VYAFDDPTTPDGSPPRDVLRKGLVTMALLGFAAVFSVLAIVFWILGARGIAGLTAELARQFVIVFIILTAISLLLN
jgi:uncharacterized membrane protein YtjA (UPF0391 family)